MKKTIFMAALLMLSGLAPLAFAQEKGVTKSAEPPVSVASELPAPPPVTSAAASVAPELTADQKNAALTAMKEAVDKAKANIEAEPYGVEVAKPGIIEAAAKRGAQVQYMGEHNGFTGWIIMEQGEPTYIYVSSDEKTIFRGLMFDEAGKPVTVSQIAEAQMRNPAFFGLTADQAKTQADTVAAGENMAAAQANPNTTTTTDSRKPDQILYDALGVSNFFKMGATSDTAPVLYAFIDPDCPHCKEFIKDIDKDYLQTQKLQLRIIPTGVLGDVSANRTAYLLSRPDPASELLAHIKGEKELPAPENLTMDGAQLNLDLFKLWRFDGTPILVFKAKDGTIMLVRGKPNDVKKTIDLIAGGARA